MKGPTSVGEAAGVRRERTCVALGQNLGRAGRIAGYAGNGRSYRLSCDSVLSY